MVMQIMLVAAFDGAEDMPNFLRGDVLTAAFICETMEDVSIASRVHISETLWITVHEANGTETGTK